MLHNGNYYISLILHFFQSDGNIPFARESLNVSSKGLPNESPRIFNIRKLILSWSWALFGLRSWIIFNMSLFTNFTVGKRLSVRKWSHGGSLLSFLIKEHCFAKKELKRLSFFLKISNKFVFVKKWWNNR